MKVWWSNGHWSEISLSCLLVVSWQDITLRTCWASNILLGATENWNVLAYWATRAFFSLPLGGEGRVLEKNSLAWWKFGYFLELHSKTFLKVGMDITLRNFTMRTNPLGFMITEIMISITWNFLANTNPLVRLAKIRWYTFCLIKGDTILFSDFSSMNFQRVAC